jgi:hypothetical protein
MKLKYRYETKDLIPAEHLPHYEEREGVWHLEVEGAVDKSKLDDFRANNIALLKERDELKQRFDGIDPDQARAWQAEKARLEQEQAAAAEKLVEAGKASVRAELEERINVLASERDALNERLFGIHIDQVVLAGALQKGLHQVAIPDITARARATLKMVDGAAVVMQPDGVTRLPGKDGLTPMTLEEWLERQRSEAPHLFNAYAGGGATLKTSGGGAHAHLSVRNPFHKDTWNLTEQARLQKTDPQLAARLREAA